MSETNEAYLVMGNDACPSIQRILHELVNPSKPTLYRTRKFEWNPVLKGWVGSVTESIPVHVLPDTYGCGSKEKPTIYLREVSRVKGRNYTTTIRHLVADDHNGMEAECLTFYIPRQTTLSRRVEIGVANTIAAEICKIHAGR
jgi:hypothetical protein